MGAMGGRAQGLGAWLCSEMNKHFGDSILGPGECCLMRGCMDRPKQVSMQGRRFPSPPPSFLCLLGLQLQGGFAEWMISRRALALIWHQGPQGVC